MLILSTACAGLFCSAALYVNLSLANWYGARPQSHATLLHRGKQEFAIHRLDLSFLFLNVIDLKGIRAGRHFRSR
jgi:hypothetical protein